MLEEKFFARIGAFIVFLVLGFMFVRFPNRIQNYYLEFFRKQDNYDENSFVFQWLSSSLFIHVLRLLGILCLAFLVLILLTMVT